MKKSRKKGIIIGSSVLAAMVVIGVGGWAVLKHNQKAVKVAPVSSMNQGGWYNSSEVVNYGTVTTNFNQDIYYDETLTVTDVYVNAGDMVKIGDPLIAYDTTLATLELEMKQMQIEGIALNIQNVQAELAQLKSTTPVASSVQNEDQQSAVWTTQAVKKGDSPQMVLMAAEKGSKSGDNPDQPESPVIGTEFPEELRGKTIHQSVSKDAEPYNEDADGSEEHPGRFLCVSGAKIDAAFMKKVLDNQVICIFEVVDDAENPAWILYSWMLDGRTGQVVRPEEPEGPDVPEEPETPDIVVPSGPTYEELKEQIEKKEQELKTLDLDKREAELDLKKLRNKVDNGVIVSTVNGMVKTVLDEETARMEGTPMIRVTGEQGFYVTGKIAETALDKIEEGMPATVMVWETGMSYEASVTSVGGSPESGYNYGGNENMSYFPFTVVINGDADLTNGQGVELSVEGLSDSMTDDLYISRMFVREEGNQYYVYKKDAKGFLTKQYVEVGKIVYDTLEILSGLSEEDEIAFPYGKDVKEGVKTESVDTLYEYY